ncbi:MAG: hypothetical protein Q9227_004894 [Pyrenula ochraceoflavens]
MLGLQDVAASFQKQNITALLYDSRSIGGSDGQPRNEVDPWKQAEDYSDALTWLKDYPTVEPGQIFLWGMSLSASVALSSACLDKRAAAVICVCPIVELQFDRTKLPQVLMKCMKDRESQTKGNTPFYIPMLTSDGKNPAGFSTGIDQEQYAKLVVDGTELAPTHVNRTTIQSYYKTLMWQPSSLWSLLSPTPVLFIIPECDTTCPADIQLRYFERLTAPKRSRVFPTKTHMDILEGTGSDEVMLSQTDFVRNVIAGALKGV